jgi:4'-phosphopantetheinyl transferase
LSTFAVSLVPGEPAALLSTGGGPEETARWTLTELFPGPDYAGALAVEGSAASLTCWQWSDESRGPKREADF